MNVDTFHYSEITRERKRINTNRIISI